MSMMNRMQYGSEFWDENEDELEEEFEDELEDATEDESVVNKPLDRDGLREVVYAFIRYPLYSALEKISCDATPLHDPLAVLLIHPDYSPEVMTAEEGSKIMCVEDGCLETDVVFDDTLLIRYDEDDVLEVDGMRYLLGDAIIFEIDENGDECSIDKDTIYDAVAFMGEAWKKITVDGETFEAFRLD